MTSCHSANRVVNNSENKILRKEIFFYYFFFFNMHYPTDRIAHTTAFVIPVVEHWLEREIAQ